MPVKIPSVLLLTGALVLLALLLLLSTPSTGKAPAALPETRHVTAVGEAEVKVKPDQAVIRLLVMQRSVSAATAEAAHRRQLQQFTALLRERGAESDRILVGPSNLKELPQVVGGLSWSVESELRVTVRDLAKVDGILEMALSEGATLQGVDYGLASPEAQVEKALAAALANARSRAESIASGTSGTVGAPVTVEMLGAPEVQAESAELVRLKLSVKATFPM